MSTSTDSAEARLELALTKLEQLIRSSDTSDGAGRDEDDPPPERTMAVNAEIAGRGTC
jgi:hypothetical protein